MPTLRARSVRHTAHTITNDLQTTTLGVIAFREYRHNDQHRQDIGIYNNLRFLR